MPLRDRFSDREAHLSPSADFRSDPDQPRTAIWPRVCVLLVLVLLVRGLVYPVNEYLSGDAVSRVELAERWAKSPHVIRSFGDGAAQYGPLQLYLVGVTLKWIPREEAAKLVNLVFGVLTVIPIFMLTRRYFGVRAATWACLGLSVWSLHIQLSTTGGSEALALFLMWTALAFFAGGLARPSVLPFAASAVAMNLAAATRYDAWMYIPLLGVMPALMWRDLRAGAGWGALFVLLCLPYPLFWMAGNAAAHGNAFYPFTYINDFHRMWVASETHAWGALWFRLQGLGFWPAIALITLSPGVAILGAIGMFTAVRTALFIDFVPLARFTVLQVSLLLPFIALGVSRLPEWLAAPARQRALRATVALAVLTPVALGAYAEFVPHSSAEVVESVGPTSTNRPSLMAAAHYVRDTVVRAHASVALDEDATYQDIQLGFYGRVDETTVLRLRWRQFREQFERHPTDFVVLFARGRLLQEPWVHADGARLTIGGSVYDEVLDFDGAVRVFRRRTASARVGAGPLR